MRESQHIEWKESWHDDYIKWICGFANASGGMLIIGKNDKGDITGIKNAKKLLDDIPNKVKNILGIIVDVNYNRHLSKEYIEIKVDPQIYPVNYKGQYHYRSGSTKQELKGSALDSFLLKKHGLHWDGIPIPHLCIDSFEQKPFTDFAKRAIQSKRLDDNVLNEDTFSILKKLRLVEGEYIKKAAALLFYDDPEAYVIGAYIKIGFFQTDADLIYQDEIHGNLFQQVEKTMDLLLTKYLKAYISYEKLQRVENFLFPEPALRETLLNAVVHKDYASGNPIQISVYDDKIIFWNAGRLPEELTIEQLHQKHPSIPFNPLIAATFFRAGYIEAWGRGIEKIMDECRHAKISPPIIQNQFNGIQVKFQSEIDWQKDDDKNRMAMNDIHHKKLENTRDKIVRLMSKSPDISSRKIADILGLTKKAVEWQIKRLKNDGIIKRVGPPKGGKWVIISQNIIDEHV
jgi:ATP-dependent DNA helicase RecG